MLTISKLDFLLDSLQERQAVKMESTYPISSWGDIWWCLLKASQLTVPVRIYSETELVRSFLILVKSVN